MKRGPAMLALAGVLALVGCAHPYRAPADPRAQEFPAMTRRVFAGTDPDTALRAAAWTMSDVGYIVVSLDAAGSRLTARDTGRHPFLVTLRAERFASDSTLVELRIDSPYGGTVADPDHFESFFTMLGETLGATPILTDPPPLGADPD